MIADVLASRDAPFISPWTCSSNESMLVSRSFQLELFSWTTAASPNSSASFSSASTLYQEQCQRLHEMDLQGCSSMPLAHGTHLPEMLTLPYSGIAQDM